MASGEEQQQDFWVCLAREEVEFQELTKVVSS